MREGNSSHPRCLHSFQMFLVKEVALKWRVEQTILVWATVTKSPQTQWLKHCVYVLAAQSCLTLCNPLDHSPPCSSANGILQAGILQWVAVPCSRGIFLTQGLNLGILLCRQILYHLPAVKPPGKPNRNLLFHSSGGKKSRCLLGWFLLRAVRKGAVPGLSPWLIGGHLLPVSLHISFPQHVSLCLHTHFL